MNKFSQRLKELRIEKSISQEQLAKETGFTQSAVYYWENEQRVPNANVIIALAKYFGVTTDYLLGVED